MAFSFYHFRFQFTHTCRRDPQEYVSQEVLITTGNFFQPLSGIHILFLNACLFIFSRKFYCIECFRILFHHRQCTAVRPLRTTILISVTRSMVIVLQQYRIVHALCSRFLLAIVICSVGLKSGNSKRITFSVPIGHCDLFCWSNIW